MKKYLILVKHSQPEVMESLPARAWKLSEVGRARARQLAEELARFQPQVIVSSDEPKAVETAEIVARRHQLDFRVGKGLHEHDRSNVPYLSQEEFQQSIRELFQEPDQLVLGTETANQAYARFYQAVHSILSEHKNETVVLVTHGTVISLFVSRLTGRSELEIWNMLGLPSFIAIDLHSNTLILRTNIV